MKCNPVHLLKCSVRVLEYFKDISRLSSNNYGDFNFFYHNDILTWNIYFYPSMTFRYYFTTLLCSVLIIHDSEPARTTQDLEASPT